MNFDSHSIVIGIIAITIVIMSLGVGFVLMLVKYMNNRQQEQARLADLKIQHAEAVMSSRLEMQEQTYQQISREIHDNINLSLSFSLRQLESLANLNTADSARVQKSVEYTTRALNDLATLSRSLNTNLIMRDGFVSLLEDEVDRLRNTGKYHVDYSLEGREIAMDPERELLILRVIQESLNNIIKHSAAQHIKISILYLEDHLQIEIVDNGQGFIYPVRNKGKRGAGLDNIETRVKVLNGRVSIVTELAKGTAISLYVPYQV